MTTQAPAYIIEFYKDAKGETRRRDIARNGNIVADSGEGYKNSQDAVDVFNHFVAAIERGDYQVRDLTRAEG